MDTSWPPTGTGGALPLPTAYLGQNGGRQRPLRWRDIRDPLGVPVHTVMARGKATLPPPQVKRRASPRSAPVLLKDTHESTTLFRPPACHDQSARFPVHNTETVTAALVAAWAKIASTMLPRRT
jgi:hypothetical protein